MLEFIRGVAKGNGKQQDVAGAREKRKRVLDDEEYKDTTKHTNHKRLSTSIPPPSSWPTITHPTSALCNTLRLVHPQGRPYPASNAFLLPVPCLVVIVHPTTTTTTTVPNRMAAVPAARLAAMKSQNQQDLQNQNQSNTGTGPVTPPTSPLPIRAPGSAAVALFAKADPPAGPLTFRKIQHDRRGDCSRHR